MQPAAGQRFQAPPRPVGWTTLAFVVVVTAALFVQRDWVGDRQDLYPWLWGTVGVLSFAVWRWSARVVPPRPLPARLDLPVLTVARRRAFRLLLGSATVSFCAGMALLWRDLLSSVGAWLWLAGLVGTAAACAAREAQVKAPCTCTAGEQLWKALAVGAIAAAFMLRLYRLDTIPPTFLQDEGAVADWGLNYLHHTPVVGQHVATAITLFRNGATAYPLLGSYLHALVMQVAGENTFGLRLTAAVCGGMTVWVFYLIASTYLSRWAAVAATFLLAVSHVHIHWTRLGLLQSMTTLAATLVVWLVLRGLRSEGYLWFVLGGLCLGFAQYLYEGARFLAPVLALFFVYVAVSDLRMLGLRAAQFAAMATTAFAVFAPIGMWYYQNPEALLGRSHEVFIFAQPGYLATRYPGMNTVQVVLAELRRSLLGFAYFGDGSGAFDALQVPLVDPVTGALVLVGILGFSLRPRRTADALVALWIWVPIAITCTVTVDPPPMTRLIMVFPALFFVIGTALDRLGWLFGETARRYNFANPTIPLVVAGAGWAAMWNCGSFFLDYPAKAPPTVWTIAGHLVRAAGPSSKTYMVSPMHLYFNAPEMRFLARGMVGADVASDGIPVRERGYRNGLFLVSPALPDALQQLRATYPNGQLTEHADALGRLLFTAYRVDAAELNTAAGPDAPWRQYDLRFGMGGKARGEFTNARGLAVGADGSIYIADAGNGRIDVFDSRGNPLGALGRKGTGEDEFRYPCGVAVAADATILSLDCQTRWIMRFSRSGQWLGHFGGPEHLIAPTALAVAPNGNILVTDAAAGAIRRFDASGTPLTDAGTRGDAPGQLMHPDAIAIARDRTVYVADSVAARVQRFSSQFEFQLQWPLPQGVVVALAVADVGGDAVYVTDPGRGLVQRCRRDGSPEWTVGGDAKDPFKLLGPVAVATDAAGSVYVLDGESNQVLRYDVTRVPQ